MEEQISLCTFEDPKHPHETNDATHYYKGEHDYGKILQPVKV
jgi:hypothetical protein